MENSADPKCGPNFSNNRSLVVRHPVAAPVAAVDQSPWYRMKYLWGRQWCVADCFGPQRWQIIWLLTANGNRRWMHSAPDVMSVCVIIGGASIFFQAQSKDSLASPWIIKPIKKTPGRRGSRPHRRIAQTNWKRFPFKRRRNKKGESFFLKVYRYSVISLKGTLLLLFADRYSKYFSESE